MADETPESSGVNGEPPEAPPQSTGGETATPEPEPRPDPDTAAGKTPAVEAAEPWYAPATPSTPTPPAASAAPAEPGQRRITRHTTTATTRTETTTDETIVETIAVAPPVWAAPAGEHPRPVG